MAQANSVETLTEPEAPVAPPTGEAKEAPKQAADGGMPEFKPPPAAIEEDSEDDLPEAPQPPRTKQAQTPATPATPAPAVPASPASPLDATIQRLYDDLQNKEKRLLDHIDKYTEDDGAITNKKARNHRKDLRKQYNKAKADYEAQIRGRETPTKPPSGAAAPYDETDGTGEEDLTGQGMNHIIKFTDDFFKTHVLKGSGPMFKQIEQIFKGKRRLWK